jgi:hypothetical protein
MNKEQQELVGEAYEKYCKEVIYHPEKNWLDDGNGEKTYRQLSQDEFINNCKNNPEFSEKWGLKIEERELNYEERRKLFKEKTNRSLTYTLNVRERLDENGIPTKLITITYNNKTIESYE